MAMAFLALWFGLKVREKISVQEFESVSEMLAKPITLIGFGSSTGVEFLCFCYPT